MSPEEIRTIILDGLADGKSLRAICREEGMPSPAAVVRWASLEPEWAEHYARARAIGDEAMFEDIQHIADTETDAQKARVRIDARKWMLGKRQPKKYGDKVEHEHNGTVAITAIKRTIFDPNPRNTDS